MNLNGYSVDVVREHNLRLIMHFLYEKPQSCKELSIITGLSETAIKKNIVQLIENNLVKVYEEPQDIVKSIGRQHIRYIVNKDYGEFMLLDLSYDNNDLMFTDILGNVLYSEKVKLSNNITKDEIEEFAKYIKTIVKTNNYNIKETAISLPGQINEETGIINFSSRISEENNNSFIEAFKKNFKDANIYVKNDLRYSIYGDPMLLERSKDSITSYILIGNGIVASFVKNGKIIHGINGISGEIGSTHLDKENTVHDMCAVSALVKKANKISKCESFEELLKLYNGNDKIKELVLDSAKIMATQVDALTNAFGSNEILFLGYITSFKDEYKKVIQDVLNLNNSFKRNVEFIDALKYRKDGMINVLKEHITEYVK